MKITQKHLTSISAILNSIAKDLVDCGTDEWESLEDCISATKNNLDLDLEDYKVTLETNRVN